jgi:hypothetical protein
MRGDGERGDGRGLRPGEIWLIEQHATGVASGAAPGAFAAADVVLYDRALAPIVAELFGRGVYAEPITAAPNGAAPGVSARAAKLASEGWRVVQLVEARGGDQTAADVLLPAIVQPSAEAASRAARVFTANGLAG